MSASRFLSRSRDLLRLAVGGGLLTALLLWVDLSAVGEGLRRLTPGWVAALFGVSALLIAISCAKWDLFLRSRGTRIPFPRLLGLYVIGYFFNNFTLGNVGGDLVRGAMLGRDTGRGAEAFGSVFMERFTGFLALFLMALLGAALRPQLLTHPSLGVLLAAVAVGFAVAVAAMAAPAAQDRIRALSRRFDRFAPVRKLAAFAEVLFHYHARRLLVGAMGWSLAFQLMTVVNTATACLALELPFVFLDLMVLVPLVLLLAALPISPNSWGLMEGGFVFFLGMAGIGKADALAVALVLRMKTLVLAVLGGLLLLAWRRLQPPEDE